MTWAPENITGVVEAWVADDIAQSDATAVSSWLGRVAASNLAQATGAKQPTYRTAGINGKPAVDFDGSDDLLRFAGQLDNASSGHVFAIVRADALSDGTVWASADEATTGDWLYGTMTAASQLEIGQMHAGIGQDGIRGGTVLATATNYLWEWRSTDTAYELRVDGALEANTVVTGADTGDWFADTTGRDNFTVGMMKRTSEILPYDGKLAVLIIVDGTISASDRMALYSWVSDNYGIALPSSAVDRELPRGLARGVNRGAF